MRKTILSLLLLCWIWKASAQEEPAKKDIWQFSLSSGVSTPLGSFARHDAANAVIYDTRDNTYPLIIGINKSKDGFAKAGYYYNATVSLLTKQGIVLALRGGRNLNGHRTNELQTFINDYSNAPSDNPFYANDYSIGYLLPGLGYGWSKGSWQIQALIMGGVARCNYPFYKMVLDQSYNLEWLPAKPWPTLHAFAWGGSVNAARSIGKHFFLQADLSYLQSSFGYYMQKVVTPAGGPFPSFVDKIKWKVFQSGLSVGFKW